MSVLIVAAALVARRVFDLLTDQLGELLHDKLARDSAEVGFEQALSAAVARYAADGERRAVLAEVLLCKNGVLSEDLVVGELAHIVRFDRPPDPAVIVGYWCSATRDSEADFGVETDLLLEYLRAELRGIEPFRAVFDAKALDQIAVASSATTRERSAIRGLINFLEDRRLLHDWATGHSVATHFVFVGVSQSACLSPPAVSSIREIRTRIGETIDEVQESSSSTRVLKRMQATCRWALDMADQQQSDVVRRDPDNDELWDYGVLEYGMTFLGLFRKKLGFDIGILSEMYDLEIQGPLAEIVEMDALFARSALDAAERLLPMYKEKHGGFRDMGEGWYEELCAQVDAAQQPWTGDTRSHPRRRVRG